MGQARQTRVARLPRAEAPVAEHSTVQDFAITSETDGSATFDWSYLEYGSPVRIFLKQVRSLALGIAEGAYREAYQYAQKRVQFGSSIDQIPAVYRMLLSMRAEIEATRAYAEHTGERMRVLEPEEVAEALLKGMEKNKAIIVPGSGQVKRQAEAEGLDAVFTDAGFQWREPGCSMCLAMNPHTLRPRERCASTSNRNFEGRQGMGGRTHLVSPAMAAAAAINGHFTQI